MANTLGFPAPYPAAATRPARPSVTYGQKTLSFTHGVACGEASDAEVVLWTRTSGPATLVPEMLDASGQTAVQSLPAVQTAAASDYTVRTIAAGLPAGTTVRYRFRGPSGEVSPVGTCRTAPSPGSAAPVTFAFSGDADWKWRPYPIIRALNKENVDFFFFLGDLIYETTNVDGTTSVEDLAGYRAKYRENRELPDAALAAGITDLPLRTFYQSFGQYAVFNNHETGVSQTDAQAPRCTEGGAPAGDGVHSFVNQTQGFKDRIQAFSEYEPLHSRTVTGTGDPRLDGTQQFFYTQRWGKDAELIVADDRSYRDVRLKTSDDAAADSPTRTMLGKPQLAWLEDQLVTAQQNGVTWKFLVVSSPIQQFGRASEIGVDLDGTKSWAGGYRAERDTLLRYIDEHGINNVIFLTTDDHATKINNLRYRAAPGDNTSPLLPARNAFEILTGPLGAGTGLLPVKADVAGLSGRDVDRRVVETLVGDRPNTDGVTKGQKQAGLDPLGLEPDFPGLIASSLRSSGGPDGVVDAAAFGAFNQYAYAVLTVQGGLLTVRLTGISAIDPQPLTTVLGQQAHHAQVPAQILSFQIRAQ